MKGNLIALAGPRCCGKTSVGKTVADRLCANFVDSDIIVSQMLRVRGYESIKDFIIKTNDDWPEFRRIESEAIESISSIYRGARLVLALGGGAVANDQSPHYIEKNCALLKSLGAGFYIIPSDNLEESARILVGRMGLDSSSAANRPAFSKKSPYEEMFDTLNQRDTLYREFAGPSNVIITGDMNILQVAEEVLRRAA